MKMAKTKKNKKKKKRKKERERGRERGKEGGFSPRAGWGGGTLNAAEA
jgi:hypothetical protein